MQTLDFLSTIKSSSTNLISLIIKQNENPIFYKSLLKTEQSAASNIKDRTTRSSVLESLKAIDKSLSNLKPCEKGYAIFIGQCVLCNYYM